MPLDEQVFQGMQRCLGGPELFCPVLSSRSCWTVVQQSTLKFCSLLFSSKSYMEGGPTSGPHCSDVEASRSTCSTCLSSGFKPSTPATSNGTWYSTKW
eukprot:5796826-Amphidinium_carterae.1